MLSVIASAGDRGRRTVLMAARTEMGNRGLALGDRVAILARRPDRVRRGAGDGRRGHAANDIYWPPHEGSAVTGFWSVVAHDDVEGRASSEACGLIASLVTAVLAFAMPHACDTQHFARVNKEAQSDAGEMAPGVLWVSFTFDRRAERLTRVYFCAWRKFSGQPGRPTADAGGPGRSCSLARCSAASPSCWQGRVAVLLPFFAMISLRRRPPFQLGCCCW